MWETCFECGGKFDLVEGHHNNYYSSGLCPKCWDKALEESSSSKASIEARLDIIISILTSIKEDLSK